MSSSTDGLPRTLTVDNRKVTIFATGGTIAGRASSAIDTTHYESGVVEIAELLDAVPALRSVADIRSQQIANVGSQNMTGAILIELARAVNRELAKSDIHGVVVTHGTDTLESTALFLDLTINSPKPIIVTGSMRPSTAISADGPMSLLGAVSVAASDTARNRGTLIVMGDRIGSAFYTSKTNTTTLDAFSAPDAGYLGVLIDGKPRFYYSAARPSDAPHFDLSRINHLPRIDILYGHQDQDSALIEYAVRNGAKGIVIAGVGDGYIPTELNATVEKMMENGIPVVLSTRTGSGFTNHKKAGIGSGFYNPQKARILLGLALAEDADMNTIRYNFATK
ncbi:asparaginase [Salinisphaera sp.]|uniref:asparaginase n=1 Tax=Salinisphaera sp. TaxID=1914330 RepID=UPI002D7812C6|nr:asparaginase [Salinisphaera sp.]HET7313441.1 asparaginase [Salinisphaera sp.]